MYNVKKDSTTLVKKGDKYLFDSQFTNEIDREEYDKIVGKLRNQIKTIKKIIQNNDVEKKVKNEIGRLKQQLKSQKEAYKNFDKYFDEEIKTMQKNKEIRREELKKLIDNHENIKKASLNRIRGSGEEFIKSYDYQLKHDEKMLKLYEAADE